MKFIEALKKLESSDVYKEWKSDNPKSYLAHGFIMDSRQIKEWQIGYYNPETEKILTFVLLDDIMMNPESEIMNKKVKELDINKIKITVEDAFKKADEVQMEKYSAHLPLKKIAILQCSETAQIWNITFVTRTFKTINIQVDTESGKVISDKIVEVFKFD